MRADEFLHFSVDDEEVVDEVLVGGAVDATLRADRLADVRLQMRQQMQAILVRVAVKLQAADATTFFDRPLLVGVNPLLQAWLLWGMGE